MGICEKVLFILCLISFLKLTNETFNKGYFNLQEYTNQSFGVYHGEVLDVELLFDKELSEDASQYNFHPTQVGKFNDDGTYSLNFKASGSKEIIWHIFKWGAGCKIIKPQTLREQYKRYLSENLKNY